MTMTAGMAHGTADWQLDLMRENENARIWESQNQAVDYEPVISQLNNALCAMDRAESLLRTAAAIVGGSALEGRIMSVLDGMDNLEVDIGKAVKDMKGAMGK